MVHVALERLGDFERSNNERLRGSCFDGKSSNKENVKQIKNPEWSPAGASHFFSSPDIYFQFIIISYQCKERLRDLKGSWQGICEHH